MGKIITLMSENSFVKTAVRCGNMYIAAAAPGGPRSDRDH